MAAAWSQIMHAIDKRNAQRGNGNGKKSNELKYSYDTFIAKLTSASMNSDSCLVHTTDCVSHLHSCPTVHPQLDQKSSERATQQTTMLICRWARSCWVAVSNYAQYIHGRRSLQIYYNFILLFVYSSINVFINSVYMLIAGTPTKWWITT